MTSPPPGAHPVPRRGLSAAEIGALAVAFLVVALWQAAPAFEGEFLSDDFLYIVHNSFVHELSWENLVAILDPWGEPTIYTVNYAPVHLLLHALEWAAFGPENMVGWHVVNAAGHALTALVLVAFFLQAGLPRAAAVFGGAVFLVHPANAETVAWIFQLKTIVSLALALGALILLERHPAWATALLAVALLTKITALFVLPVAAVQLWTRQGEGSVARWGWLAGWVALSAAIGVAEMQAFQVQADPRLAIDDPIAHARFIVAIGMRYLVMAYTGWGTSTFHEPPPADSWLDPWWLAGLVAIGLLGWRTVVTLARRDEEAAFWVLAAASFAPVSQIFPFIFPMGDRYLYPILPGLLGGALLAAREPAARLRAWAADRDVPVRGVATAGAIGLLVFFGLENRARGPVFVGHMPMLIESALNYPDGMHAHLLRGHRAAADGRGEAAARAFRRAVELGFTDLEQLLTNPSLAPVRGHPDFQALLRDLARMQIQRLAGRERLGQSQWISLGIAYRVNGQPREALQAYEQGLALEGPLDDAIRARMRDVERDLARSRS